MATGLALSAATPALAQVAASDKNEVIKDQLINFKDIPSLIKNPTFVTLRYDNADIREVLRLISTRGGMNLILDDSVTGRFTIDVRAVPLDEFFGIVLRTNGLAARRVGTSLLIAKEAQLREKIDATQAATFRLNNAPAADVAKLLKEVVDKSVKLLSDDRTNSLLVVGTGEDLTKIKNAIRAIDIPAPQVVIECKLVEVATSAIRDLGGQIGFGGSKFGVSSNVTDPSIVSNGAPTAGNPSGPGAQIYFAALGNFTSNLNARVNALVKTGEARILANPRIGTQDSQKAEIRIVNKFPVVSTNFQGGGNGGAAIATETVDFKDIGEKLIVTPRIDTNGYVTLDIEPTISVRGKDVIVNRNAVPEINERYVKTKMRVADGETVVIGGLIRRNTNRAISKFPVLGDLPIVGFMFRQETTSNDETEVIIMVTPHITSGEKPTS
jgi:type IV pilus secretin PilQ/predicted competence protein